MKVERRDDLLSVFHQYISRWIVEYNREDWVAVTGGIWDGYFEIIVYVDREVTEEDIDSLSILGGYVLADFAEDYQITEKCLSLKEVSAQKLDFWVFNKLEQK